MKKLIVFVIIVLLAIIGYYYRDSLMSRFEKDTLTIVTSTGATDISPYALNLNNATRIRNVYEGLVAFDRSLRIVPALAISWGYLSDTTWEFRLRGGVLFHDGSALTAQDVVDVYQRAKASGNTQIATYISTIKDMKVTAENRIVIETYSPDPLLLSKLTKLYIYKDNNIGTGPYMIDEWIRGETFDLSAFPDYWGQQPAYDKVRFRVIPERTERQRAFANGEIDILVGLTEEQAMELPEDQIVTIYGLEVNFLMFRLDDPLFKDINVRKALQGMVDPAKIEEIGNHFVRHSNQFLAPGVFGFNQDISVSEYDPANEPRDLFGNRLERVNLDHLASYNTLVQYLVAQLEQAGFSVRENTVTPDELLDKIGKNESQLFLVGWQAEDGDAGGFYDAFIHSGGPFNNGRYKNDYVDKLIEASRTEMVSQKRLSLLKEINARVAADYIGIPLYETSRIYGLKEGIKWKPRLDGLVLAAEVRD